MTSDFPNSFPPEMQVFPLAGVALSALDGDHPFHVSQVEAARENWRAETAVNPDLFDGKIVFFDRVRLEKGVLTGEGYLTPFSTFLLWRKQTAPTSGVHIYGWAIPVTSDGAIIAIRMGPRTANAGLVYCAAGSLDANDITGGGACDLTGNLKREVREETGLDLAGAAPISGYYALYGERLITVYRYFRFDRTAEALLADIARHMQTDEEQEIDAAVAIRSADPQAYPYSPMMLPILRQFFAIGIDG